MTLLPVVLPEGFAPKVSVNDKLTAGDIIAEKKGKGAEEAVNVSQILKDSPKKMTKFFKKNLGDSVSKGEIIAVKKGTLGFGTKKIIREFSGTVVKIDTETGNVVIHVTGGQDSLQKLISPVDGTVDFCDNEKIVIKTQLTPINKAATAIKRRFSLTESTNAPHGASARRLAIPITAMITPI